MSLYGNMKTGLIGLGKMGGALARGMLASGALAPHELWVYDHHEEHIRALQNDFPGVHAATDEAEVAQCSELMILAVKPKGICPLLRRLAGVSRPLPLTVSVAAAVKLADMQLAAGEGARIIRAMPNTPCTVRAGLIAYSAGKYVTAEDEDAVCVLMSSCGTVLNVHEEQMNAVAAIAGSGPAYMFVALDALADAGVAMGLPRHVALQLAAVTMRGSADLLLQTGQHPMALRDAVTSPGGTTIAALNALDACQFRHAWHEAVKAACARAEEMES